MIDVDVLSDLIAKSDIQAIAKYMRDNKLELKDGKIVGDPEEIIKSENYWDKRQLVRKINLNSAYGALLNSHCRYYDKRIGQSVTLTGRSIVQHQMAFINEQLTGEYVHDGAAIIYGDTDSGFFSAYPMLKDQIESGDMEWSAEKCIELYDAIGDQVNESFPDFMYKAFHTPLKNGAIIKAGRELVADRGLFIVPKRYAVNIIDKEGKRKDKDGKKGEIKAMGLDLKRSDTPKHVQEFLMNVLKMVLYGDTRDDTIELVKTFKRQFAGSSPWTMGSPKSVNNLTTYGEKLSNDHKATLPGHVKASLNWNKLRSMHGDNYSMKIVDGMRIVVCKLLPNPMGFTSIAYPTDESRLPSWFIDLPFDTQLMTATVIDKKLENLLGVLNWNFKEDIDVSTTFGDLFSFE